MHEQSNRPVREDGLRRGHLTLVQGQESTRQPGDGREAMGALASLCEEWTDHLPVGTEIHKVFCSLRASSGRLLRLDEAVFSQLMLRKAEGPWTPIDREEAR